MARNTFTKRDGATFKCDVCSRLTRHTGAQAMGSELCPLCWDLAGFENELSDNGGQPHDEHTLPAIRGLLAELAKRGGNMAAWADLAARANKEK